MCNHFLVGDMPQQQPVGVGHEIETPTVFLRDGAQFLSVGTFPERGLAAQCWDYKMIQSIIPSSVKMMSIKKTIGSLSAIPMTLTKRNPNDIRPRGKPLKTRRHFLERDYSNVNFLFVLCTIVSLIYVQQILTSKSLDKFHAKTKSNDSSYIFELTQTLACWKITVAQDKVRISIPSITHR